MALRYFNALFELIMTVASFGFFVSNIGEFRDPKTHPQWRFAIAVSLFVGLVALAFFIKSVRNIRREPRG